jgi:hypothetical protein
VRLSLNSAATVLYMAAVARETSSAWARSLLTFFSTATKGSNPVAQTGDQWSEEMPGGSAHLKRDERLGR